MPRENKTKYAVLGILSNKAPMSGYDIKKRFEDYLGKCWSESYGQIYPIIRELVKDGLATRELDEHSDGKPDRYIIHITEKGLEELKKWLPKPADPQKLRLEVLLKLTCGVHISIEDNIKIIQKFKDEWTVNINTYKEIEKNLRSREDSQLPYWLMTISCGMHIGRAFISWCDETIASLKAMQDGGNIHPE